MGRYPFLNLLPLGNRRTAGQRHIPKRKPEREQLSSYLLDTTLGSSLHPIFRARW
jgi:hypothetical protein